MTTYAELAAKHAKPQGVQVMGKPVNFRNQPADGYRVVKGGDRCWRAITPFCEVKCWTQQEAKEVLQYHRDGVAMANVFLHKLRPTVVDRESRYVCV